VLVVVVDVVVDESFELSAVRDDGGVEGFSADGSDPAFGEGVRYWCAHGVLRILSPWERKPKVTSLVFTLMKNRTE